jgi:PPP family 3-phenylpropionic acid transporter
VSRATLTLRALYFVLFGFLGGSGNYLPLWLEHHGWSDADMGWFGALRSACLIVAPLYWGRLADRDGSPRRVLLLTAAGSALAFLPQLWGASFALVMGSTAVFHLFREGIVPAADTAALNLIDTEGGTFGQNRIWGSLGFIAGGFFLAAVVSALGRGAIIWVLAAMLVATVWLAAKMPAGHTRRHVASVALRDVFTGPVVRFLVVILAWRIAIQGFYQFLPLHLGTLGVPDAWVPAYWAVGVVAEIGLFAYAERLFGAWPARRVFVLCLVLCALQTALAAVVTSPWLFLPIMLLHGFSFGLAFYTTVVWLSALVPPERKATIQAVLYAFCFGVGGAISSSGAGYLYEHGGGRALFEAETVASLVTVALALLILRDRSTFAGASTASRA